MVVLPDLGVCTIYMCGFFHGERKGRISSSLHQRQRRARHLPISGKKKKTKQRKIPLEKRRRMSFFSAGSFLSIDMERKKGF